MKDLSLDLLNVPRGSHVCWVLNDPKAFHPIASAMLGKGKEQGEKVVAFGPEGSSGRASLEAQGAIAADPLHDFLGGGPLRPEIMFEKFKELTQAARAEGYTGLRVIADMDWLLPESPNTAEIVSFELLLDRMILELGATVICVYPRSSFDGQCLEGVAAVHPYNSGVVPNFMLTAVSDDTWRLSGEVDICALQPLSAALETLAQQGDATISLDGLTFIDCSGMRALANALASAPSTLRLKQIPSFLERLWTLASLNEIAPLRDQAGPLQPSRG